MNYRRTKRLEEENCIKLGMDLVFKFDLRNPLDFESLEIKGEKYWIIHFKGGNYRL